MIIANNPPPAANQKPRKSIVLSWKYKPITYKNPPPSANIIIGNTSVNPRTKKPQRIHNHLGIPNIEIIKAIPPNAIAAILKIKNIKKSPKVPNGKYNPINCNTAPVVAATMNSAATIPAPDDQMFNFVIVGEEKNIYVQNS